MTNNPQVPLSPEDPEQDGVDVPLMKDADGKAKLDPDANEDLIDSSEADRIAADGDAREG